MLIALALSVVLSGDPDTIKVAVHFENATLDDVLNSLTQISQVPIELDDAAKKKIGDPAKLLISIQFNETSVTGAAKLIFGARGLQVKVVDNKKLIVTVP